MAQRAKIGRTIAESVPAHVGMAPVAPPGAPNVVVIVLDDLGFGQLGCFGSDIATPKPASASPTSGERRPVHPLSVERHARQERDAAVG